jgi:hypothetical protein
MTSIARPAAPSRRATAPIKPTGSAGQGLFETSRPDAWWVEPAIIAIGFGAFILYSLFSALVWEPVFHVPYEAQGYLSPFFSPLIRPAWMPWWFSPAILILWIPLGFRTTCYYYRKAYYRAYFVDPPACAVGEPRIHTRYRLETAFPFILQNIHRYFLYLAFIPLFFLWLDAFFALRQDGAWRIGLIGVVMFVNVALLTGYSLSCHSFRHIVGGKMDCFSCSRGALLRYRAWQRATWLNIHHQRWAWASLISVAVTDLLIRLLAIGVISDPAVRF